VPANMPDIRIDIPEEFQSQPTNPEPSSWFQTIKLCFWKKVVTSSFGFGMLRLLTYSGLAFSAVCFCLSLLYGSFLFTSISLLAVVMIMLNIELVNLNHSHGESANLYDSMSDVRDDLGESSASLKEHNAQLRQETLLLKGKIKKLESLLLGMEKVINDSHNLNGEQTAKFTAALSNIIHAADLSNAEHQAELAKVLINYEGVSDRLAAETAKVAAETAKVAAVTSALELKTIELASANAALCDTNKDFKKVCASLEVITTRLEQLYKVGVISEQHLTAWSGQLRVTSTGGGNSYLKSTEINQNFIGLQSFCDSLGAAPCSGLNPSAGA
tara:strand:- start:1334 stop:2320 length:987 start_codon:yes stop_codon:yes gene_type:complete